VLDTPADIVVALAMEAQGKISCCGNIDPVSHTGFRC
jgi:hypothetical protein